MDDNLVWSAYEPTYSKCKDLNICPHNYDNNCFCYNYLSISPTIIANCGFLCNEKPSIKNKCYIAFGEICSICMEPIVSKKNAWLTPCNHQFHRKCLINNHEYRRMHNMTLDFTNEIPCPVCRDGLVDCCVGLHDLNKYNTKNGLDKLENFWLSINIAPYLLCYKCNKGLGMNISCETCEYYRNTGCI